MIVAGVTLSVKWRYHDSQNIVRIEVIISEELLCAVVCVHGFTPTESSQLAYFTDKETESLREKVTHPKLFVHA